MNIIKQAIFKLLDTLFGNEYYIDEGDKIFSGYDNRLFIIHQPDNELFNKYPSSKLLREIEKYVPISTDEIKQYCYEWFMIKLNKL